MPEVVPLRRRNANVTGKQIFAACSRRKQAAWCDSGRQEPESETATHLAVSAATLALAGWLRSFHDDAEKARVLEIGKLTGLKEQGGRYFPANFERALLVREIIRRGKPKRVLELGTGRGLGILAMADQVQALGYVAELLSVDIIAPAAMQNWPICLAGENTSEARSVDEVWNKHFPKLRADVTLRTGATTTVLPALFKDGRKFDFIFVDAGHDVYSVFHDFAYSCLLLAGDGEILMDDFAPTEPFGLGTCIVAAHATKIFEQVEVIETNGLVFDDAYSGFTRGMVHLAGIKRATLELDSASLLAARILGKALECLFHPKLLPIRLS
jgi:predicted O-methyltransferase YrrM